MGSAEAMNSSTEHRIRLGARVVDYRIVRSKAARRLRVRVGPDGVEVVQPISRNGQDVLPSVRGMGAQDREQPILARVGEP